MPAGPVALTRGAAFPAGTGIFGLGAGAEVMAPAANLVAPAAGVILLFMVLAMCCPRLVFCPAAWQEGHHPRLAKILKIGQE
jgi:hypothetical protein